MKYKKPVMEICSDYAEGIYAASGSNCYTTFAHIVQSPVVGRGDYRIQINAVHNANHTSETQKLIIQFNQNVSYVLSNGELINGNNTDTLIIKFSYWQNEYDNIGLGELIVVSDENLEIKNVKLTD